MSAVTKRKSSEVLDFRWLSADGTWYRPRDMVTRHLFHTVSMIWNHSMPPAAHTHRFKRYEFGPYYTTEYMATAVRVMLPELLNRKDIKPEWLDRLRFMATWFNRIDERLPLNQVRLLPHA